MLTTLLGSLLNENENSIGGSSNFLQLLHLFTFTAFLKIGLATCSAYVCFFNFPGYQTYSYTLHIDTEVGIFSPHFLCFLLHVLLLLVWAENHFNKFDNKKDLGFHVSCFAQYLEWIQQTFHPCFFIATAIIFLFSFFVRYFHSQNVCLFNYRDIQLIELSSLSLFPPIHIMMYMRNKLHMTT